MSVLRIIITIIYILVCASLAGVVLAQEGKSFGLGSLSGSTYWDKAKSRSKEGMLKKLTIILSALFFVLSIAMSVHPFA